MKEPESIKETLTHVWLKVTAIPTAEKKEMIGCTCNTDTCEALDP